MFAQRKAAKVVKAVTEKSLVVVPKGSQREPRDETDNRDILSAGNDDLEESAHIACARRRFIRPDGRAGLAERLSPKSYLATMRRR